MDEDYEQILLVKPDVFVYRIPPRSSISRAHRASDWKLDHPDWKGRLRLVLKGQKCILKLEDKENCRLFAECFIENFPGSDVESVSDSSRYFVIKIKNPNDGRLAFIGIGFEDRSDSFDLNVALQDHFKRVIQEQEQADNEGKECENAPKIDLSLKEGQTIKVNLNIGKKSSTARPKPKTTSSSMGVLLPPPPNCSKATSSSIPLFSASVFSATTDSSTIDQHQDILSSDIPKTQNVPGEFNNVKSAASGSNDDWSDFSCYKQKDKSDSKLELDKFENDPEFGTNTTALPTTVASTDQTSSTSWATFF